MLSPSFAIVLVFVYGFILFTVYLSFTDSKILPSFGWVGWQNYERLFGLRAWYIAVTNLLIFGSLYIVICCALGLLLAILLDQKIRAEGFIRTIYLYPMALCFIVTGTAWKWFLDPGIGLQAVPQLGLGELHLRVDQGQRHGDLHHRHRRGLADASGFVMAMFLAGLRGIDTEVMKAAQIDGALDLRALPPDRDPAAAAGLHVGLRGARPHGDQVLRPGHRADRRRAGTATELPATFMYSYTFTRNQMGIGAASAVIMLMSIAAIMVPFIWSELREKK